MAAAAASEAFASFATVLASFLHSAVPLNSDPALHSAVFCARLASANKPRASLAATLAAATCRQRGPAQRVKRHGHERGRGAKSAQPVTATQQSVGKHPWAKPKQSEASWRLKYTASEREAALNSSTVPTASPKSKQTDRTLRFGVGAVQVRRGLGVATSAATDSTHAEPRARW